MKELLLVSVGSFFGGGLRYAVSRWLAACTSIDFPLGTFAVNVTGCFIIGFLSGVGTPGGWLSPQAKLLLTTGFCGGFTTFSTFMNESFSLVKSGDYLTPLLYAAGSVTVGFAAVVAGHLLAKS
jgi:fluoride exporter